MVAPAYAKARSALAKAAKAAVAKRAAVVVAATVEGFRSAC